MKDYPPLVCDKIEDEYESHYQNIYCREGIRTFWGMRVVFPKDRFHHLFYESSKKLPDHKDRFSKDRAQRINWIAAALRDDDAEIFYGWSSEKKCLDKTLLVFVVQFNYVVVVKMKNWYSGRIVTAYLAKPPALHNIKSGPKAQIPSKK